MQFDHAFGFYVNEYIMFIVPYATLLAGNKELLLSLKLLSIITTLLYSSLHDSLTTKYQMALCHYYGISLFSKNQL